MGSADGSGQRILFTGNEDEMDPVFQKAISEDIGLVERSLLFEGAQILGIVGLSLEKRSTVQTSLANEVRNIFNS